MTQRVAALVTIAAFVSITGPGVMRADEGMWVPQRLDNCPVDTWRDRGLDVDVREIWSPDGPSLADAVVKLGGGTGSFVSLDGLIVTNHHVAFGAVQRSSAVGSDHLADGFLAADRAGEIPAPGFEARVLLGVEDVTARVLRSVKRGMGDRDRFQAIEKAEKALVEAAEKGRDVYCQVAPFYGGREYYLYTYFRIKDVRIVYTPPQSIGEYGGDVDNWMWPRHTGDFAFVRAYVAPDGKSAEYSAENVPFRPKRRLVVSRSPLAEGAFTMVLGYPGSTQRHRSSHEIDFFVNSYYPRRIQYYGELLDILERESARGRDVELKLTGMRKSLANTHKNNAGMLEGLQREGLLARKVREEQELAEYLFAHPDLEKEYGRVFDDIGAQYQEYRGYWEQMALLRTFVYASPSLRSAMTAYRWAVEREKKDIDREPGYQDRDRDSKAQSVELAARSYDAGTDRSVFAYFLGQLTRAGLVVDGISAAASPSEIDAAVESMHGRSRVMEGDVRVSMFGMSRRQLLDLHDPLVDFAARIHEVEESLDERHEAFTGALLKLRSMMMALLEKYRGVALYPDANSTMRLSVGEVKGYSPRDAVEYGYQTMLGGVVEKHTGRSPFDAPHKLLDLEASGEFGAYADPVTGDVPVCLLSTNDVTGGSSGSPILNGHGELIGLVFDGNYESISADYQFIPRLTRTISVDSRYILFLLDRYAGAEHLLDELEIVDRERAEG
jgi:hypothetical protein